MSSRVTRPAKPVPGTRARSTACSRASRRTAGVIRPSYLAPAATGMATAGASGGGAMGVGGGAGTVAGAGRGATGAGDAALVAEGAALVAAAGASTGAAAATASPVSMIAISASLGTVCPSATMIFVSVPANGDGTSAFTLSVTTSTMGSPSSTCSPTCLSHLPMVPSATLSPSWGMVTVGIWRRSFPISPTRSLARSPDDTRAPRSSRHPPSLPAPSTSSAIASRPGTA